MYVEKAGKVGIVFDESWLIWVGDVGESVPADLVPIEVLLDFTTKANACRS